MKVINKIYGSSPIWLQNVFISIYGFKLKKIRYGKVYKSKFNYFSNYKHISLEQEFKNQDSKLVDFVKFAQLNSPFYREKYKNIDLSKFDGVKDIKLLPIVSKEEFRENLNNIHTIDKKEGIPSFTGGTTGKALEVIFTHSDAQERMAYLDAFKYKLGIDPFLSRKATFSGREITNNNNRAVFWRYNRAYRQQLYSTFNLNDNTLPLYIKSLNKYKPEVINGFVSAIYEVAKFVESNKIRLNFKPKAIFTTSETLLPFHRELIERVFYCKVYNQYASAEGAPFITECKKGQLHYNIDTGVIETDDVNGKSYVTSFTTHGTPLIRYDIGDHITFKPGVCVCGSLHPLVKEIKGRAVDYLESVDGFKVSLSHLADVIKGMPSCVKNVQFVQTRLDEVIVRLVIDDNLYIDKYDDMIIDSMKVRFGNNTRVLLDKVESINREKSGKFALVKKIKF